MDKKESLIRFRISSMILVGEEAQSWGMLNKMSTLYFTQEEGERHLGQKYVNYFSCFRPTFPSVPS